ncbi:bacteriocin immunity protein [Companilactobacillus keshanensis]|uniref:Bacteriocin immunity protein n=1 Tax=Companilactobacillus keshanensis TaxID=2486003 RepID=A0ABW4BUR1_9LACO|nr:bacteriocin immunity protein [Companilactobacillus keshanensis]
MSTLTTSSEVKTAIEALTKGLLNYDNQSPELLDIIDVLGQVEKKIDEKKHPETLVIRMINYIRSVSMRGKIHFLKPEENIIIDLGTFGQKAGLNGQYMADFSDKSQFYSFTEQMPRHN